MYKRKFNLIESKFNEYFLPTLLMAIIINICCTVINSVVISYLLGEINLSVIQVVSPFLDLFDALNLIIGVGGSILVSISKAKYDEEKSNYYFTIAMLSLMIISIIFTIILLVFSNPIIDMLGSTSDIKPLVKSFFMLRIIGMPIIAYITGLTFFIRVDGNPKMPFIAMMIAYGSTILFNFLYISFLNFGIEGAALSFLTGYTLSLIYVNKYFFKKDRTLKILNASKMKITTAFSGLKEMSIIGLPSASSQIFTAINLFALNFLISYTVGASGLIAFNICYGAASIINMFLIGTSETISPIVSVYNQEEDSAGVKYIMKKALSHGLIFSIVIAALFIIYPQLFVTLYSIKNPLDIINVINSVRIYAISFVGIAITFIMIFYTQAIKRIKYSLTISIIRSLIIPIVGAYTLVPLIGFNGVWVAFILAEVFAIAYIFIYSKYIEKKTEGEYSGLFLLKKHEEGKVLDLTCNGSLEEIDGLIEYFESYLKESNFSEYTVMRIALVIEEMLANIVNINDNIATIDYLIKIEENKILISIKDQGKIFDPTTEKDNFNIKFLNDIADNIEYSRVLGLNCTIITISQDNNI